MVLFFWPKMGRPPILNNDDFLSSVHEFEKDDGREIGKKDMTEMLKSAQKRRRKGNRKFDHNCCHTNKTIYKQLHFASSTA